MSITSAFANANSGLSAMSRSAEVISNNVSNALTEGYSRQEVAYAATVIAGRGGGVSVGGVSRGVDVLLTTSRQRAEAEMTNSSSLAKTMERLAASLGLPDSEGSLAARVVSFETSIRTAIATPESSALQNDILVSAKNLTSSLNRISTETTRLRVEADASIARQVATVNSSLEKIEALNAEIRVFTMSGRSVAGLEDQRQVLVDTVNAIIPIRQSNTNDGEVALFFTGGEILLNGSARKIEFTATNMMTPSMSISSGALSGLSISGVSIPIGQGDGAIRGGSLAAGFNARDIILPKFHMQIDALARDLVERLQDPAIDPTLAIGDAGLFTDAGAAFSTVNETGLAGRISVNSIVDPANGGVLWKMRDGLGAVTPSPPGNNQLFIRLSSALDENRLPTANLGLTSENNASGFTQEMASYWISSAASKQAVAVFNTSKHDVLLVKELDAIGVDTDQEMQKLMLVEQAYAANARVLSVIDGLMKTLLEI